MKHKHLYLGTISVFTVLILGGLFAIWPRTHANETIAQTETKEIGPTQSIGGETKDPDVVKPSTTFDNTLIEPEQQPTETKPTASTAPKQDELDKKITRQYEYRALAASNDPLTQTSWALSTTNARTAWDNGTGNGVVVAVIDSGYALAHEDLADQWQTNAGEVGITTSADRCWSGTSADKKTNACDDDNNGYVDDWRGWNFVDRTNTPQAGLTNPTGQGVSHGTQVAGLVGAKGNNGVGIATMAWNNKIMPLQALDDNGAGFTSSVTAAVYYAVDNGAKVINMSLGGDSDDPALQQAIDYAYDSDVVVIAAAGNCGTGLEAGCDPTKPGAMGYPALYPHVIAVGASDSTSARASFSSYGPALDVIAPGSGTLASTMWTPANQSSAYSSNLYGTSFASPIVASYAGLLLSLHSDADVDDIVALIDASAHKTSDMDSSIYTEAHGHGIIDARAGSTVALGLATTASVSANLKQTGSEFSEHTFTGSSSLSSGCSVDSDTYCTIWARDERGYDRYLPYKLSDADGNTAWAWNGATLGPGDWSLRSRSGSTVSTSSYSLFMK